MRKRKMNAMPFCRGSMIRLSLLLMFLGMAQHSIALPSGVFSNNSERTVSVGIWCPEYMSPGEFYYLVNVAPHSTWQGSYPYVSTLGHYWAVGLPADMTLTKDHKIGDAPLDGWYSLGVAASSDCNFIDGAVPLHTNTNNDPNAMSKDPINVMNGNVTYSATDIVVPCPRIPLEFRRTYNSTIDHEGSLGHRWTHSYDWRLKATNIVESGITNTYMLLLSPDKGDYSFKSDGASYLSPSDNQWRLQQLSNSTYEVTMPGVAVLSFDTNGVLQAMNDLWGNEVTLSYSNSLSTNLLIGVAHNNGQELEITYSGSLISQVGVPSSSLNVYFYYNGQNELTNATRVTSSDSSAKSYYYYDSNASNYNHSLTQIVNAVNDVYSYGYVEDAFGFLTSKGSSMVLEDSYYHHELTYATNNERSTVLTYYRGNTSQVFTYNFEPFYGKVGSIIGPGEDGPSLVFGFDSKGNNTYEKNSYDNDYVQFSRIYDSDKNLTNQMMGFNSAPTNAWLYTWETNWNMLASSTDPEGAKIEIEYTNASPSLIKVYYNASNSYNSAMTYTTNGLLESIVNANNHWVSNYFNGYGFLTSSVPQAGVALNQEVNDLGFVEKTFISTEIGTYVISNDVDEIGRIHETKYEQSGDTNSAVLHEYFYWDAIGNLTNFVDKGGRSTRYTYLPSRKLSSVSRTVNGSNITTSISYDNQFNTLNITDPMNRAVESYVLDIQDRPVCVTNLEGQTMTVSYGLGAMVRQINRFDGTTVSNSYNTAALISQTVFPDITNSFTYLNNNLPKTISDGSVTISNSYNGANWITNIAVSGIISTPLNVGYSYLPAGNVSSIVSVAGTKTFGYDAGERVTDINSTRTGTSDLAFDLGYDQYRYGQLEEIQCTNTGIKVVYYWDNLGNIGNIIWYDSSSNVIRRFNYSKNNMGMITSVGDGGGIGGSSYTYDDLDRLVSETKTDSSGVIFTETNTYDVAGNRISKVRDGIEVTYSYSNGNNRLTGWSVTSTNLSAQIDVTGVADEDIGADSHWGEYYISNSVSLEPEASGSNFWAYDFPMNLGTQSLVAAIRDDAGNTTYFTNTVVLTIVTNASYEYSDAGCLTNMAFSGAGYSKTVSLGWNQQYQLTAVSTNGTECERNGYDATGRRVWSWDGSETNYFAYDGAHIVADLDATGGVRRSYVTAPGIDNWLAMTVYTSGTAKTYFYITDHLGTVHALTDENGDIVESYRYDAWGRVLGVYDGDGVSLSESAVGNRILWQGREYSWNTGLYYFRARWYDPITGRWLSKDPIGISGGLNQYVFCKDNPVNFTDPSGLVLQTAPDGINTPAEERAIMEGLSKVMETPLGRQMVEDIIASDKVVKLMMYDPEFTSTGFVPNSEGGGILTWDPFKKQGPVDCDGKDDSYAAFIGLGHELGHAWASIKGLQMSRPKSYDTVPGTTPPWEEYSMALEEIVRGHFGYTPRGPYWPKSAGK